MGQGLQVFDEYGNCILDISTVSTEVVGYADTGKTAGSITNNKLVGKKIWVKVTSCDITSLYRPKFAFEEIVGKISWTFEIQDGVSTEGEFPNCRFVYGVY